MTDETIKDTPEEQDPPLIEKKRFLGQIIDNKYTGVMEYYDDDKNLVAQEAFDKGVLHGESRKYDLFHHLKEKITYKEGELHGPAEFYKNGIPLMHTNYAEGKQQGETTLYDEAGMVRSRIQYAQGLRHGTSMSYDSLGRVQQVLHYTQDLLDGPLLAYYPSGSLMESGNYEHGKRQGEFKSYHENGVVQKILIFEKGRQMYPPQFFDINGYPLVTGIEK